MKSELLRFCRPNAIFGGHILAYPYLLDHIYFMHGYPVAQGPAIPPVDKVQYGSLDKSLQQVFDERTEYSHSIEQGCFEWIPNKIGLDAWHSPKLGANSESYNVVENDSAVAGAASLKTYL